MAGMPLCDDYDLEFTIADDDGSTLWTQAVLVKGSSAALPGRESVTTRATADHR
jgi:hypothetical protein